MDRLAGRPARGLHRRSRGRRRGPAHLLGRPADPGHRVDGGRRGTGRHLGRPAGHQVPQGLRDPRPRRRPAPAAPVRAGQRPGHRGRRHRVADRERRRRARVLEAVPRRPGRQAMGRHRWRSPVHPGPGRPGRAAGQPDADRRPAVLPVRPRGHREHLLLRPGRHPPGPAYRPRRRLRAQPEHGRAPDRLPRRGRPVDAGRPGRRRAIPDRHRARSPRRGPRAAAHLRRRSPRRPGLRPDRAG